MQRFVSQDYRIWQDLHDNPANLDDLINPVKLILEPRARIVLRENHQVGCALLSGRCIETRCPLDPDSVSRTLGTIYRIS